MDEKKPWEEPISRERRRLVLATSAAGAAATVATAIPFLASMAPSERTKSAGAPVEADVAKLPPGELLTIEWRGKPVWILHRSAEMVASLGKTESLVADPASSRSAQPAYCLNSARSARPEYFVAVAICTHLGCVPGFRPDVAPADLGPDWVGGFYCPCHGSRFDLAGRVFKNVPAPENLEVPPYRYLADGRLLVGEDKA